MPNTEPHHLLKLFRPDEVAECWEGVSFLLYNALWNRMSDLPPLGDLIDIEDSCPQDAIGINSVASVWDRFTPEQKAELNALAEQRCG